MSYEIPSDERRDRLLRKDITFNRHIARFTPAFSVQGDMSGVGAGSKDQSIGPVMTSFALNPEIHNIEGGGSDEITLQSASVIVDHTSTITLRTINGASHDGQIITLKPLEGKSMTIVSGGNIDVTTLAVDSDEFVIMQFFEDNTTPTSTGSWTIVQSATGGGGDNLGNHTATSSLLMEDNAIYLDTAQLQSIFAVSNANNYIVDINGGAHDFYIDDLVVPKFGITETDVNSNVDIKIFGLDINPSLVFNRDYDVDTPTAEDVLAKFSFLGDDNASNELQYGNIQIIATDVVNGSETGRMRFSVAEAGSIDLNGFTIRPDTVEHTNQLQTGNADPLEYIFYRNNISGAVADDELGQIAFDGKDSDSNRTTFAELVGLSPIVTNGSEVGSLEFKVRDGGGLTTAYTMTGNIGAGGQPQHSFEGHGLYTGIINSASVGVKSTHASDPDNTLSLSTLSGSSNVPEIITTNAELNISVGGANRINIDASVNTDLTLTAYGVPANFILFDDDSTPNDNDIINSISFRGRDSGLTDTRYASIIVESTDVTDATEDGTLYMGIVANGIDNGTVMTISPSLFAFSTQSTTNLEGAEIQLYRNDTLSNDETVGQFTFLSKDSSGSKVTFAEIEVEASDILSTSKDSRIKMRVRQNNIITTIGEFNQDGLTLEEITASSTPAANHVVVYGKDVGGVTKLFYKQDNGVEVGPLVDGISASEVFVWTADHDANGNVLILDPDGDSSISSASDDSIQVATGGSVEMSVTNGFVTVSNALIVNGNSTLGNAISDTITFNGVMSSDIDLNANSLILDADGDTKIQSGTDDTLQFTVGASVRLSITNTSAVLTEPLTCTDIIVSGGDRIRSSSATEMGYFVKNATSSLGSAGSMQMPVISSLTPTVANLNAAFGSEIGCFGLYNTAAANVVLAIKNQASEWIVIACGDASATVISDHIN